MALHVQIAKWVRNRARMYRWQGPKKIKGSYYRAATNIDEVMAFFASKPGSHEDPLSSTGVLCFHEFGMDLLQDMKNAAIQDSFAICYYSPEWGYVTPQLVFVGRKRT